MAEFIHKSGYALLTQPTSSFSEEMNRFHCYICRSQQAKEAVVNEIFQIVN